MEDPRRTAMYAVLGTLFVAAVSALAFIAYRHPVGYRRLAVALAAIVVLTVLYTAAFKLGHLQEGIRALERNLLSRPDEPLSSSDSLISSVNRDFTWITRVLGIAAVALAYLALLWFLPAILGIDVDNPS